MKTLKKINLNQLDKNELEKREQLELQGGDCCCGTCGGAAAPEKDWESNYVYKVCP